MITARILSGANDQKSCSLSLVSFLSYFIPLKHNALDLPGPLVAYLPADQSGVKTPRFQRNSPSARRGKAHFLSRLPPDQRRTILDKSCKQRHVGWSLEEEIGGIDARLKLEGKNVELSPASFRK